MLARAPRGDAETAQPTPYVARRDDVPVCTTLTDTVAAVLTLATSSR
ncbi:hypothetical protein [Streptomyces sp. A1547]|nr:hypothetical protein [Streptomyces sp. A1547]